MICGIRDLGKYYKATETWILFVGHPYVGSVMPNLTLII